MHALTIAAASFNLSCSPAMLITRHGWEIGLRIGRCLIVKDECIVKRSAKNVNRKPSLSGLEGGQVSPRKHVAAQCFCGLAGGSCNSMKLEDAMEPDPNGETAGVVFKGTSVPIKLLFDFLEDDQTLDTFLDQFPAVSRDQARAVLGASRDMLLSTASSEI